LKLLLIDNYDSFTFNLYHYLQQLTTAHIDVVRNDNIDINKINNYQSIVLSPGPGLPNQAGLLMEVLKHYAHQKKILGVCLGMQAMVQHFGGTLKNLKTVQHGVSKLTHIISEDKLYKNMPVNFYCGRYHSWVADANTMPDSLKVTAVDDEGEIMSISHKYLPCYGVQFHPESIMTPFGKHILNNWLCI
jgi:anthranilate synthase component 2